MAFDIPSIHVPGVPENERETAFVLNSALTDLDRYARDFQADLVLFDFASNERRKLFGPNEDSPLPYPLDHDSLMREWVFLAARDGAMSIYNFYESMKSAQSLLRTCPTVRGWIDGPALRLIVKLFESRFPHLEPMRHALAHAAELSSDIEKYKSHSVSGDVNDLGLKIAGGKNLMVRNHIAGRTYANTYKGQLVKYDISLESLNHMIEAKASFYEEFVKVAQKSYDANSRERANDQ